LIRFIRGFPPQARITSANADECFPRDDALRRLSAVFAVLLAELASGKVASSGLLGVVTDPLSVQDVTITVRHELV
jgi:hypothetical protein